MEDKRIRICDIAEELGLSTATVSNVIHGKTKKISDETVRRVQALIEERQYIPSMAGILLAQNNSRIIGIIVNNHEKYESHVLEDPFIASSLNYLSLEIEKAGQFMMVKVTDNVKEIIKFASMWNLDGMVLIGFCEQDYKNIREMIHIPFVIYDGYFGKTERVCNLMIDNYDGGFQVGRYFRKLGHQKVLYIADNKICMDLERYEGFRDGFKNPEISPAPDLPLKSPASQNTSHKTDFLQIPMPQHERRLFYQNKLEKLKSYTAIFAASDYYAVELMFFLLEQNVRVPEDVSIAGFDDNPICRQVLPALTSVKQDNALRARLAVEKLRELKNGQEQGSVIKLPVALIERGSTCAL